MKPYDLTPRALRVKLLDAQIARLTAERKVLVEAEASELLPANHPDCATERGYKRHKRYGEAACDPCLDAHAAYTRSEYARNRLLRQGSAA